MMADLTPHEIAALKIAAGMDQDVFTGWGAAFGAVMERLQGHGFVTRWPYAVITEKGRKALAKAEETANG